MQSEKINDLLIAIENARENFKSLKKSGSNPFFKTNGKAHQFSTLDDIFTSCKEALANNEISVFYTVEDKNELIFLTTTIMHLPSGQYIKSSSSIGTVNSKPIEIGSGITYFRRYHIQAMLNLEADFEDDGNIGSGNRINETFNSHTDKPKIINKINKEKLDI
jgi:hypothetical protein